MWIKPDLFNKSHFALKPRLLLTAIGIGLVLFFGTVHPGFAADRQFLSGHVPPVVARLQPVGRLPGTNCLNLTIGLPLRNQVELDELLRQLYDPASTNFHKFLLPAEFAARFGPTEEDYQAVQDFVRSNGLVVTSTYNNRVVLDLRGRVADVERACQVNLRIYRHPFEARDFFAPDTEPSLPANLRVTGIEGLSDYSRPRRADIRVKAPKVRPLSFNGSGPGNQYAGNDFRNAYVPGTALTGAGQTVALLEYSDYFPVDITNYENVVGATIGTTNYVPLTNVVVGGTTPDTGNNGEVALDIEMAIAMAPKLSRVMVYEKNTVSSSLLNQIATDNLAKQVSSSWLVGNWSSSTATNYDSILKNMATQGQSYFQSSGDGDAYTGAQPLDSGTTVPADSPYATIVGGTTLTMNGSGASWSSETVWNYNLNGIPNEGSGGGISSYYPIPYWQTNVSMANNGGSTANRNTPDVALTADNVFVSYDDGDDSGTYYFMGTSCAAPLWAGFCALVNQQSTTSNPTNFVGFLNPALYAIGTSAGYGNCFQDITTGNNIGTNTPGLFYATSGYDLCTGWGTPNGMNLINALAPPDALGILPGTGFTSSGPVGGPFNVTSQNFSLTNSSGTSFNWSLVGIPAWLNASPTGGTLTPNGATNVTVSLNSTASNLAVGTYSGNVWFTNQTTGVALLRQFTLQVLQPLAVSPTNGFTSSGPVGGSFSVTAQNFSLANLGPVSLNWSVNNTAAWLTASPNSGALAAGGQTTLTVSLNSAANGLVSGIYNANVVITNQNGGAVALPFTLLVGQPLVQNGGFETGDFTGWTLIGDGPLINFVTNSITYNIGTRHHATNITINPHSGTYFAALGESNVLAYLSQTLPTFSGQAYLLSLWMDSPDGETPNEFNVSWNGNTLINLLNMPILGWTNLQFIVTASGSSTVLQIGARDDPTYLALDDVSVIPIPATLFQPVTETNGTLNFTWNALTGLVYQVQYTTNLLQTNWINLGNAITATNVTATATNLIGSDPQRFYRLQLLY
jgi:subtilase family serine protease